MFELIITKDWDSIELRLVLWAGIIFFVWTSMAIACIVDLYSGVSTAKALGQKIHSHGLRDTMQKIKDYAGVMLPFLFVDMIGSLFSFYYLPFIEIVIGIGSIFIEGWSVFENNKRKKSGAGLIPELAKDIVKCAREKDAEALIESIQNIHNIKEK